MKPSEQAVATRRRQRILIGAIGVVALLALSVASFDSFRKLQQGRARTADIASQIAASEARLAALERRVVRLREDPGKLEQLAREELMMARPGEIVIVLPEAAVPASEPPAASIDGNSKTGQEDG